MDTQISIATHKPNAFIDLSGWSPKYFPPKLVRAAYTLLQDKVLSAPTSRRVQLFAEATDDQQWIHTDPERAKAESPFGGPIFRVHE